VHTGELVAVIGPSGTGKTTLLRALAGVLEPTEGESVLGDHPVTARSAEIGYLPVGDTLHPQLTVREALGYAASLRLPATLSAEEIDTRTGEVLEELRLTDRADARIKSLSGGEHKRAAVAAELVGRPAMLLLDEPATGLDPGLERRLMKILRRVAAQGRGVVVVTHATSSLALCDTVAVMGPGGRLRFAGSPDAVLEHFGVEVFDDVYEALEEGAEDDDEPEPSTGFFARPAPLLRPPPSGPFRRQTAILAGRYARCVVRDGRTLWVLLVQAPVIAICIGVVLPRNVLAQSNLSSFYAVLIAFLLITGSVWLGVTSACREIVKERAIVEREAAAGVRLAAYLAAKVTVLFALGVVQVGLLVLITVFLQPLHQAPPVYLAALALCVLAAWASVAMGLAVSAYARSPDQASSTVPLLLIPQLLFAGAIIPTSVMPGPVRVLSDLTFSRWALAGLGRSMGLADNLSPDTSAVAGYQRSFFALSPGAAAVAMGVFAVIALFVAARALDRRVG
jgi:ABC-type multidrug transport system ATPase subunit/ABC-type multidrug transport system permease subunit